MLHILPGKEKKETYISAGELVCVCVCGGGGGSKG